MSAPVLADVVELTRHMIRQYFNGNPKPWFDCLSPKSIFVCPGEDMLFGAENIKTMLQQHGERIRGALLSEQYTLIPIHKKAAIVIAHTANHPKENASFYVSTVYTFVYQLIGKETKLIYEHSSYEYFKEEEKNEHATPLSMDLNTLQFVKQLLMAHPRQERLCIQTGRQTFFLDTNTVIYARGDRQNSEIVCVNQRIHCPKMIKELLEELPENFYQIHRSYIINIRYLLSLSCYEAEMLSGVKIPIPKASYGKVKKDLEALLCRPLRKKKPSKTPARNV